MERAWLSDQNQDASFGHGSPKDAIIQSLDDFYQRDVPIEKRLDVGIQAALLDVFPMVSETTALDFMSYELGDPSTSIEAATRYGKTLTLPLRATLRMSLRDREGILDVSEDDVKIGDVLHPIDGGMLFMVGGHERIVVPQLQRSPGVFMEKEETLSGVSATATVMPKHGSWLLVGLSGGADAKWTFSGSRRGKRMPLSMLLMASGFGPTEFVRKLSPDVDVYRLRRKSKNVTKADLLGEHAKDSDHNLPVSAVCSKFLARDHYSDDGKRLLGRIGDRTSYAMMSKFMEHGCFHVHLSAKGHAKSALFDEMCGLAASGVSQADAVMATYKALAGNREADIAQAARAFYNSFFNPRTFIMSAAARKQAEHALGMEEGELDEESSITRELLASIIDELSIMRTGGSGTDTYSLENRRLRLPGELLAECLAEGLREASEQAGKVAEDADKELPKGPRGLWNQRYVSTAMDRFSKGDLCQTADHHNPLAKATHALRFSSLGSGGILGSGGGNSSTSLMKMRVPEEARHVHDSHFGRLCPLGPEGANIGLVGPLANNASVDELGFLQYPALVVRNGRVTDEIEHLTAGREKSSVVAFGDQRTTRKNKLPDKVLAKDRGEVRAVDAKTVTHMSMFPAQFLSLESSLIPFVSHDDPTRAAIASSQMRQAVPVLAPKAPMVGTGWERRAAEMSDAVVRARKGGVVSYADAARVVVATADGKADLYSAEPMENDRMCARWRPAVAERERVSAGQTLLEGPRVRQRRTGARQERVRGFHVLVRVQLRGCDSGVGKDCGIRCFRFAALDGVFLHREENAVRGGGVHRRHAGRGWQPAGEPGRRRHRRGRVCAERRRCAGGKDHAAGTRLRCT